MESAIPTSARPGLPTRILARSMSLAPPTLVHGAIARVHHRAEPAMPVLVDRCDPNGSALDVGAWYGPWTYHLSRRMQSVTTLEPNPTLAEALRRSVRPNVTVHEFAASNRRTQATLHLPSLGVGSEGTATLEEGRGSATSFDILTVPIDELALTDVRFVKIDVEGHELAVLEGARALLSSQRPVVFVELDDRFTDISRSMDLMIDLGYEGRVWFDGRWHPLSEFDLREWQQRHRTDALERGYLGMVVRGPTWLNDVAWVHPDSTWSPW